MSETRRYPQYRVGRLVSGKEVGRQALLEMPEFHYWLQKEARNQASRSTERGAQGPSNPERIRVGSVVNGEGYGVSKVKSIEIEGAMVRIRIGYGADFEMGALWYDNKYPQRIR